MKHDAFCNSCGGEDQVCEFVSSQMLEPVAAVFNSQMTSATNKVIPNTRLIFAFALTLGSRRDLFG